MPCEILDYKYTTVWDLDKFLDDPKFNSQLDPSWPLITSTGSCVNDQGEEPLFQEFIKSKRLRPSILKNNSQNSTGRYIGEKLNIKGQLMNVYASCAGSAYSFYLASLISLDQQTPVVIFSGDNFQHPFGKWMFDSIGALDETNGLPFDANSQGFKMGCGASLYIVKHPSVKSKLNVKSVIQNFSFYTQPGNFSNPGSVDDIINNIKNINYSKIDLWSAHATGTPVGDQAEYEYFSRVCKQDIPIVAYKGYVGHCLSGSTSIELAMLLDCKKEGILKPNAIKNNKRFNDDRIITESTSFTYQRVLRTSLGFGGRTVVMDIDLL